MRNHIVTIAYICSDIFMSHEGPKGGTSLFTETGTLLFTDYSHGRFAPKDDVLMNTAMVQFVKKCIAK